MLSPFHSRKDWRAARRPAAAISGTDTALPLACAAQESGLWAKLQGAKRVVSEPRGTGEAFTAAMAQFYAAVASGRGALFFAICRGKVPCTGHCLRHSSQLYSCLSPIIYGNFCS